MPTPPLPTVTSLKNAILVLLLIILAYVLLAVLLSIFSRRIARRILGLDRLMPRAVRTSPERRQTLEGLVGSLISFLATAVAIIATLSLFVEPSTLLWIVGLFSAAFGLGARGLVSNVLYGASFIFKNTFAIGEKVEMTIGMVKVEGLIEEVNLTNTLVRAPTGELYVVPNGDIGVIRNFNRAPFSAACIKFTVQSEDLMRTLDVLKQLAPEAVNLLADLTEPWQVLSTSEIMGNKTELTVMARTAFGKAALLRLHIFDLIYRRLREAGIELVD